MHRKLYVIELKVNCSEKRAIVDILPTYVSRLVGAKDEGSRPRSSAARPDGRVYAQRYSQKIKIVKQKKK